LHSARGRVSNFQGSPRRGNKKKCGNSYRSTSGFPISRDPPEGGTLQHLYYPPAHLKFPISRDPPEGGTRLRKLCWPEYKQRSFQFLGIPPKGEPGLIPSLMPPIISGFQFLGIPPKGERDRVHV